MSTEKRRFQPPDPWGILTWILLLAVLAIVLISEAMSPAPEAPTAQERAAQFFASQEYERMINLGADPWSAEQAAYIVYEEMMTP